MQYLNIAGAAALSGLGLGSLAASAVMCDVPASTSQSSLGRSLPSATELGPRPPGRLPIRQFLSAGGPRLPPGRTGRLASIRAPKSLPRSAPCSAPLITGESKMTTQFNASDFTASKAKPLPVILLLDTSGSMYGDKISSLNDAVRKMLGTFTKEESQANEFLVSVITFGGTASLAYPPTPASELEYASLSADGGTPLGAAIDVAKSLIEDREQTPGRAYRPLVVLVSDGVPTDAWETKLDQFIQDGRSAKCDRMALGIGREAYEGQGRATLERFIAGTEHKVFEATGSWRDPQLLQVRHDVGGDPRPVAGPQRHPEGCRAQAPDAHGRYTRGSADPRGARTADPAPAATTEDEDSYW